MNVHIFDGQIKVSDEYNKDCESFDICDRDLLRESKLKLSPSAYEVLKTIIHDKQTEKNHDNTNNLCAYKLIHLCHKYYDNNDFIQDLEIQLIDMKTGMCAQGRTHRLYQLYIAYN